MESLISSIEWNGLLPWLWGKIKRAYRLGRQAAVSFILILVPGRAQEGESFASLLAHSPFGSAAPAEEVSQPDVPTAGFRGYFHAEGEWFFNVVVDDSTSEQRGAWIGIGEPNGELLVKSFDPQAETVEVEHRGRSWTLYLMKARIQRLTPQNKSAVSDEPMASAEKQERLKNIAAEVLRRRAARREAAMTGSSRPQG